MKYYIIENEAPVGPFDVNELVARGLRPTDLVWAEGMADWATAESVEEVRMALYGPKNNNIDAPVTSTPVQGGVCPPPSGSSCSCLSAAAAPIPAATVSAAAV